MAAAQLDNFAQYHVNGFLYDHLYNKLHDDFLNGGVGRLSAPDYDALLSQTQSLVRSAAAKGITDIFLRLLADVYLPNNPAGAHYKFDIFNQSEVAAFQQTFHNQATFIKAAGLKGLWLDMEPYDYPLYWRQEQDPSMPAVSQPITAVKAQYFKLGQLAMRALLEVDPTIQVVASPAFGYSGTGGSSSYEFYPDFYAGMISVASQANANGIVLATEAGYGITNLASFRGIYDFEEGTAPIGKDSSGNPIYSPVRAVLQSYDAANGTNLWSWHLAHSSIALPTWPYVDSASSKSITTLRYPLTTFQSVVQTERSISPQYTWVYAEGPSWFQTSYTCDWPAGQTTTSSLPCPGLVLHDTLPPLSPEQVSTPSAAPTPTPTPTPPSVRPPPLRITFDHFTVMPGHQQGIGVTTAPGASVKIVVRYPNGSQMVHRGQANQSGKLTWSFKQPANRITHRSRTATVLVSTAGSSPQSITARYTIAFSLLDLSVEPRTAQRGHAVTAWVHTTAAAAVRVVLTFPGERSSAATLNSAKRAGRWSHHRFVIPEQVGTGTAHARASFVGGESRVSEQTTFFVK